MSKQTMGEFLALLRRANGLTQQEVADKLNISNRTLSSWETDRTTPDILLLPAIADLYGVTVDELLRCERNTDGDNNRISDEALRSAKKHRFGKFSAKFYLLSGLACFGAVLLALSFVFELYTSCPLWLFIILVVLSACDMLVCTSVLFYNLYNARLAEGLVLKEDYTEEKKAYALALKNKTAKFFLFLALPLIVFALVITIVLLAVQPENYEIMGVTVDIRKSYYITIGVTGGLGVLFLIAFIVYANVNFKSLANETQAVNHKSNANLAGKVVGFGAIPFAVFFIIMIVLETCLGYTQTSIYKTDNYEDLKNYMQTLVVDTNVSEICGIRSGEYSFTFPEKPEFYKNYNLGNGGFVGYYKKNERYKDNDFYDTPYLYPTYCCFEILYPYENGYFLIGEYEICSANYIDSETYDYIVNLRNKEVNYTVQYGMGIKEYVEYVTITIQDENRYEYQKWSDFYFETFAAWLLAYDTVATVIICGIIYFVKRKKQSYEF